MCLKSWKGCSVWMILILNLFGCAKSPSVSTMTLPRSAYFAADPVELKALQGIARTQEARMKGCPRSSGCEEAYYMRGLIALFENRADAINLFQELRTILPNSRYNTSSTHWLHLLQDSSPASNQNSALFTQLRQEVLQNLLDREESTISRRQKESERRVAELNR